MNEIVWGALALALAVASFAIFFVLEWRTTRGRMIRAAQTEQLL